VAECETKWHKTVLKPLDISGLSKDEIEEAVLGEILNQVTKDREVAGKTCAGDCPDKDHQKCKTLISALNYDEGIAKLLAIDCYIDDDDLVSYDVSLSKADAGKIEVNSFCKCVRRRRHKK
jgi:hypothetical protein